MDAIEIQSLDDPRIGFYRNLKDRQLADADGRFLAEGSWIVKRLLQSDFPVDSVLAADKRVDKIAPHLRPDTKLYVATEELINQIVGFKFHRGVLACGIRKPALDFDQLMRSITAPASKTANTIASTSQISPLLLVVCPQLNEHENLGLVIRLSAGFGADALIVGPSCCDPFSRRSVRVSMGTVFKLPIIQSRDLAADLKNLKEKWQVQLNASVLAPDAQALSETTRPQRIALLFGSEATGLETQWIDLCDQKITIPMQHGTDSLNIASAAAVFLYHYTNVAQIEKS